MYDTLGNLQTLHRDRTLCRSLLSHLESSITAAVEVVQSVRRFVLQAGRFESELQDPQTKAGYVTLGSLELRRQRKGR